MKMRSRAVVTSFITGTLVLGSAFAGVGLRSTLIDEPSTSTSAGKATEVLPVNVNPASMAFDVELPPGQFAAGAAKVSIEPNPNLAEGEFWERDKAKCLPASADGVDPAAALDHAADWRLTWIENNNCI